MRIDIIFVRWSGIRAIFHRGWWLATSLYFVTVANLAPAELVYIGVFQGIVSFVFEVPAGVVADTLSRKWSIVLSHALMGTAMLVTGLVTEFSIIVFTQMLWGISWTFASGADVAYVTDELDEPDRIANVLTKSARAQLYGSATGIVGIGLLAWITSLRVAMVSSGISMLLLGLYVALCFEEKRFVPHRKQHWLASWEIFKAGITLVRSSKRILVMFLATFLVNGATEVGRLYPKRLTDIGLPMHVEPIVWWTALGIISFLLGAITLKIIEHRVHDSAVAKRDYALACVLGAGGLVLLAFVPNFGVAFVGILLMDGIRSPLTGTLATIQVNNATADAVRATVHSFLAQAEYFGEIVLGLVIGLIAEIAGVSMAITGGTVILLATALLMWRSHQGDLVEEADSELVR